MELLAGVLSHTSWMDERGPDGEGNSYFQALRAFFEPYKEHEAVRIAEQLTRRGFVYDAPPNFIIHLSPLPELAAVHGYSEYLIRRAGGRAILERFQAALWDLAGQSDFLAFFEEQRPMFERIIAETLEGFDASPLTDWLTEFYGWSGEEFHIVFAPAMFPTGGYGATVTTERGQIVYHVLRELGASEQQPEFQSGSALHSLTLHEFSHSFVNPSVEQLQYYQQHRERYTRFDEFIPYLLRQYGEQKERLLADFGQSSADSHGYLGVALTLLPDKEYVLIQKVRKDSPADSAGLQAGDSILSIAGSSVKSPEEIAARVKETSPGTILPFQILRQGETLAIDVTIGQWQ
jgi:hypothetical protein